MPSTQKREPILDDPETLKMVKDEFEKRYPEAMKHLRGEWSYKRVRALGLWDGFKDGFEAGYWADEIPLHSG